MTDATLDNPFPGLRPFRAEEKYLFFGREGQSETILRLLRDHHFVALVGPSGSGKSSLINAGLLPHVFGGFLSDTGSHWRVATCRPGTNPIGNLAAVLAEPRVLGGSVPLMEVTLRGSSLGLIDAVRLARLPECEQIIVIVDQFEELFRFASLNSYGPQDEDAAAFAKLLLEGVRQRKVPIYIVLGLRSDYIGDCARFRDLPEAVMSALHLIPRMTREQRRDSIEGPVRVGGGTIAPRLVNRLLNDVGDNPDQLPILQHALMRAWEHWCGHGGDKRPIDLEDYEAIGGMTKALSIHAEEAYAELADEKRRNIARVAFQCLSGKDINSREARHPGTVATIAKVAKVDPASVIEVLNRFRQQGRAFLTPQADTEISDRSIIDVSHESLIRGWDRLKAWVEEEAESATIYRRLAESASLNAESKEGLWNDPALQLALEWREKWRPNADWAHRYDPSDCGFTRAMEFLDESREARDELRRAEKRRRRRVLVGTTATAGIIAVLALFAGWKWYQSDTRLTEILRTEDLYLVSLADQWTQADDAEAALPLVLEILPDNSAHVRRIYYPQAELELAIAVRHLHERLVLSKDADPVRHAALSPDGERIVTASANGATRIWNAATGRLDKELVPLERSAVNDASFSPNGKLIVTASDDGSARLWDEAKGNSVELRHHTREVRSAAFDAEGGRVVTASADGEACVWEIKTLQPTCTPESEGRELLCAAFSPDGQHVVTGSASGEVRIWKADTLVPAEALESMHHNDRVTGVTYSTDGHYIVTSSVDRTAAIWNAETGAKVLAISVGASVESAAISPDGQSILTASADNVVQTWDASTGKPVDERFLTEAKPAAEMRHFAFNFAGGRVVTTADDGVVRLWGLRGPINRPMLLEGHRGVVRSAVFDPDGKRVVTASEDSTARIWNAATGRQIHSLNGHTRGVLDASFSGDGKYIVTTSADGSARVWNGDSGQPVGDPLKAEAGDVNAGRFSPDGKQIVTGYDNGSAWIWDTETHKRIGPLGADARGVRSAVFSPDGLQILTAHRDGTARTWSARTGKPIARTAGGVALRSASYSPDGKLVVTASANGTMAIWDSSNLKSRSSRVIGSGILYGAIFSPDGRRILTASQDREARLLDADSSQPIDESFNHGGDVRSAAFASDGSRIVTASADRIARIWPVFENTQALVNYAKSVAPRCLTPLERSQISLLHATPDLWCKEMKKWPYQSDQE